MPDLTLPSIRGRYAPSPTGTLHMGNLRTALLAWLFTRVQNGEFVLRIEDLDRPRVRPHATAQMLHDLSWLGLDWDEGPDKGGPYSSYVQSERLDIYQQYLQQLQEAGLVYPCYCSRAEIAGTTTAMSTTNTRQIAPEDGPRYPGTCRNLTMAQRRAFEQSGRRPALRFRVEHNRVVTFDDSIVSAINQDVQQVVGDFIVHRSDGIFSYQFAVVVDDALMHIHQVVRGSDLLTSTARQILLYEAMGFPTPEFAHVPLLVDDQGKKLSKRTQSMGLEPLRAVGTTPEQVIARLATSCGLMKEEKAVSAQELLQEYRHNGLEQLIVAISAKSGSHCIS